MMEDTELTPLDRLRKLLGAIAELGPDDYVRTAELGTTLDFSQQRELFRDVRDFFDSLRENDSALDRFPEQRVVGLLEKVESVSGVLREMLAFNPSEGGDVARRDELATQLKNCFDDAFEVVSAAIAYAATRSAESAGVVEKANEALARVQETGDRVERCLEEAQEIVAAMRGAAARTGVAKHAALFGAAADTHSDDKKKWLIASAVVAGVVVLAGAVNLLLLYSGLQESTITTGRAIQLGLSKLVLFSVLYYALVSVVGTYRAASHNEVVNRHRQNALDTFETFDAAASDEQTKQAVLLRATECIFGHQPSGFARGGGDEATSSRLLEIIRGTTKGDGQ